MYTSFLYIIGCKCNTENKCTKITFDLFYYALLYSGVSNSACA